MERAASNSHSLGSTTPLVLNGVLSLANAGTWLQMLRSKLSSSPDRRRSDFADGPDPARDGTVSEMCMSPQQLEEDAYYPLPIRRSRSEALHDRQLSTVHCRRGAELTRASSAGVSGRAHSCPEVLVRLRYSCSGILLILPAKLLQCSCRQKVMCSCSRYVLWHKRDCMAVAIFESSAAIEKSVRGKMQGRRPGKHCFPMPLDSCLTI